jgi:hypothetical protein
MVAADPAKLEHYGSLGITEVVLELPAGTRDEMLARLDVLAPLAARVSGS